MAGNKGQFVWYELMTSDPAAALAFYQAVTGWGLQKFEGPMDYTMFTAAGTPVAGCMALPDEAKKMGAPPHWMGYVAVDDVDATAKRATELGARLFVPPTDIPGVGRFSTLSDPQGAAISIFRSTNEADRPSAGQFSWHELMTSNWTAAWGFYEELFGWVKTEAMDMGPGGTYQMYGVATKTLGGMYDKPKEVPAHVPPHWLYYIHVADLDKAIATVNARGGEIYNGPMEVPGGDRIAQCRDPQGATFALHASKP